MTTFSTVLWGSFPPKTLTGSSLLLAGVMVAYPFPSSLLRLLGLVLFLRFGPSFLGPRFDMNDKAFLREIQILAKLRVVRRVCDESALGQVLYLEHDYIGHLHTPRSDTPLRGL